MIPYEDFGGQGPLLHFAHANGYPPACYQPLFERLSVQYRVIAMHQRPLWRETRPQELEDWRPLAEDLAGFLAAQGQPVAGVGHSMGGVATLRAALRHPGLFRAIILLDPVLMPPEVCLFWEVVYRLGLSYRLNPLVPAARRRRRVFESREAMFTSYRQKAIFRYFGDDSLQALTAGLTRPNADGQVELVYAPEWEARIYATALRKDLELWRGLPQLKIPTMILRGAETDTFWERTARLVDRRARNVHIATLPQSTHLLPMERPQEVAEQIIAFLHFSKPDKTVATRP